LSEDIFEKFGFKARKLEGGFESKDKGGQRRAKERQSLSKKSEK
jgi:hypothetical protein